MTALAAPSRRGRHRASARARAIRSAIVGGRAARSAPKPSTDGFSARHSINVAPAPHIGSTTNAPSGRGAALRAIAHATVASRPPATRERPSMDAGRCSRARVSSKPSSFKCAVSSSVGVRRSTRHPKVSLRAPPSAAASLSDDIPRKRVPPRFPLTAIVRSMSPCSSW
eukprot:scaffold257180_cov31-Tisochrysis_lutea.AAC.2